MAANQKELAACDFRSGNCAFIDSIPSSWRSNSHCSSSSTDSLWEQKVITTVLIASLAVYSWKLLGYLIPEKRITPAMRAFAERVTVSLLAALVLVQGFTTNSEIVFDARVPALLVAAILLWLRAPFIVVVIAGALVAAVFRWLGF
jgi:branched-subunit amino acid transport protein